MCIRDRGTDIAPAPAFEVKLDRPAAASKDTLFELISEALGGDEKKPVAKVEKKPVAAVPEKKPDKRANKVTEDATLPVEEIDQVIRQAEQADDSGLVPPMDVGQTGATG